MKTPTSWDEPLTQRCQTLILMALQEDLAPGHSTGTSDLWRNDRTSQSTLSSNSVGQAIFVARSPGVIAGLPILELVAKALDSRLTVQTIVSDGTMSMAGTRLARVVGPMQSLLSFERTALNFLQRLSGVATLTHQFVDAIAGLPSKILDTRKTTPGWRLLEKYAVRCGGGMNHRMGLFDAILIKDNHLAGLTPPKGISAVRYAVEVARQDPRNLGLSIQVEVDDLQQLEDVLPTQPEMVLLDNMSLKDLRKAIELRDQTSPSTLLEASGGVNLGTVRAIAETGVDRISVGAITHSAVALDIGLDYEPL